MDYQNSNQQKNNIPKHVDPLSSQVDILLQKKYQSQNVPLTPPAEQYFDYRAEKKPKKYGLYFVCSVIILILLLSILVILIPQAPYRNKLTEFLSINQSSNLNYTLLDKQAVIDTSSNPTQTNLVDSAPIKFNIPSGSVTLNLMAKYSISALVVSVEKYSNGWQGEIEPVDLALAWGNLTDSNYNTDISYSQSNRWYYYKYGKDAKLTNDYIGSHSSNHHIIPANENILIGVEKIKKNQNIKAEGYLVNVNYIDTNGGTYNHNTSLTRTDSGDGACEVFYITNLQVNDKVYK